MKVLITGASGFLGKYIYRELHKINSVVTLARSGAAINVDLAKEVPVLPFADMVIHCAGKAHSVPVTELDKQLFFDVNVNGTKNLLNGLDNSTGLPKSFVFISTVAVYGCESGILINEQYELNAQDPYGQSKIKGEILVQEWCSKNNILCSILRLPLLVGDKPPGNLGAMINGIRKGYYFNIGGGKAKKSMVLAKDIGKIIPIVAKVGGIYNLTDGYHPSFAELSEEIAKKLSKNKPHNLPTWFVKIMANVGNLLGHRAPVNSRKLKKITTDLTFDDSKARDILNWNPHSVINNIELGIET